EMAMIGALKHGNALPARCVTREAQGGHHRFSAAITESGPLIAGQFAQALCRLARQMSLGSHEHASPAQVVVQGVDEEGGTMSEQLNTKPHGDVDILVPVDVGNT